MPPRKTITMGTREQRRVVYVSLEHVVEEEEEGEDGGYRGYQSDSSDSTYEAKRTGYHPSKAVNRAPIGDSSSSRPANSQGDRYHRSSPHVRPEEASANRFTSTANAYMPASSRASNSAITNHGSLLALDAEHDAAMRQILARREARRRSSIESQGAIAGYDVPPAGRSVGSRQSSPMPGGVLRWEETPKLARKVSFDQPQQQQPSITKRYGENGPGTASAPDSYRPDLLRLRQLDPSSSRGEPLSRFNDAKAREQRPRGSSLAQEMASLRLGSRESSFGGQEKSSNQRAAELWDKMLGSSHHQ